ncbi:hypothetical protein AVEN_55035-1 [Araneus ventricosus]|uniref:Uncharacterized protein n=1 Tax=Araneus ventricosus TaxID=182803 RepID=A0A4Y2VCP6_ARAVE|nr:hypothetical protein AVEN_29837-1 [Araneus ventricosus]GBO21460.1 hypothetical protein AVEN_55035-1 [Araneus ventricosus]
MFIVTTCRNTNNIPSIEELIRHFFQRVRCFSLDGCSYSRCQLVNHCYCPNARRKTMSKVVLNRRVEERRDTDKKSTSTFGTLSAFPLGEEFVLERSTKRNETFVGSIYVPFLHPQNAVEYPFSITTATGMSRV